MTATSAPQLLLPWTDQPGEKTRLNALLTASLVLFMGFIACVEWIHLPPQAQPTPPPMQLLIVDQPVVLPPPPLVEPPKETPAEPAPKAEVKPEVKPEPKAEPKPDPKPEPKPQPKTPTPAPSAAAAQEQRITNARNQAAKAGVMQAQDDIAAMRDSLDLSDVNKPSTATPTNSPKQAAATVDRAIINSGATTQSGGLNVASLSKDTGGAGGALGGRTAEAVQSKLAQSQQMAQAAQANASKNTSAAGAGVRTDEEVKKVLEAAKARITAIYYRILDEDPSLQGRMVFKLTIEPNGSVSSAQLVSSDIKHADLEKKIMALLRGLNFGAKAVAVHTQTLPIALFPS